MRSSEFIKIRPNRGDGRGFLVPAILLSNHGKVGRHLAPHGDSYMAFPTLIEARAAVREAGFTPQLDHDRCRCRNDQWYRPSDHRSRDRPTRTLGRMASSLNAMALRCSGTSALAVDTAGTIEPCRCEPFPSLQLSGTIEPSRCDPLPPLQVPGMLERWQKRQEARRTRSTGDRLREVIKEELERLEAERDAPKQEALVKTPAAQAHYERLRPNRWWFVGVALVLIFLTIEKISPELLTKFFGGS